jgi:hypothetical protein
MIRIILWELIVFLEWVVSLLGDLGSFLEGFTSLLTLVTILYVLKQTREMTRQNQLSTNAAVATLYRDISSSMQDIDRIFFENPQLRPYFYDNALIDKGDPEYGRAMSLAEMFSDFMDMFLVLERVAPKQPGSPIPWVDWKRYFVDLYGSSPAIRRYWSEHGSWYSSTLMNLLDPLPNEYR